MLVFVDAGVVTVECLPTPPATLPPFPTSPPPPPPPPLLFDLTNRIDVRCLTLKLKLTLLLDVNDDADEEERDDGDSAL